MARSAKSFRRKKAKFKPLPRTLVLCEDSKSCLVYLQEAARHFRSFAQIEISHCGKTDPIGIVNEAMKRRHKFDHVFCAIDRDNHHGFDGALETAMANGVDVVASFPSYEFWLLLHFRSTRAPYVAAGNSSAADRLIRDLRREPGMDNYSGSS
jgi:RloB-like protein